MSVTERLSQQAYIMKYGAVCSDHALLSQAGDEIERLKAGLRLALLILEAVSQGQQCMIASGELAPKINQLINGTE